MSEAINEAPLEPAAEPTGEYFEPQAEQTHDPDTGFYSDPVMDYLGDPDDDYYEERSDQIVQTEQFFDGIRAAVDERLAPFAQWVDDVQREALAEEGRGMAEEIISDIANRHGVELDAEKIIARAE